MNRTSTFAVTQTAKSSGVLTSADTGIFTAAKKVTIGGRVYTFRTTLSTGPTIPNEVHSVTDGDTCLTNLAAAINGTAGAGTAYSTGTVVNPDVTSSATASHALTITERYYGVYALASTTDETKLSWGATTLAGGKALTAVPVTLWARQIRISESDTVGSKSDLVVQASSLASNSGQEYLIAGSYYQFGPEMGQRTYMPGVAPGYIGSINGATTFSSDESN